MRHKPTLGFFQVDQPMSSRSFVQPSSEGGRRMAAASFTPLSSSRRVKVAWRRGGKLNGKVKVSGRQADGSCLARTPRMQAGNSAL